MASSTRVLSCHKLKTNSSAVIHKAAEAASSRFVPAVASTNAL